MEKEKSIWDLKLHESIMVGNFFITKVPGGWIYQIFGHTYFVFVPISGN
jgi:hypothetical protein